jgi:hypothetical protein
MSDGLFIKYYPIISLKIQRKYERSYLGEMIQTRIKPKPSHSKKVSTRA